mmetsp:Transcript_30064/g.102184  ORF Transcript_30064/g.102184 Transcript_30064/m.102184 type:complete len:204 (+) Transcript_30064:977-1588(+)
MTPSARPSCSSATQSGVTDSPLRARTHEQPRAARRGTASSTGLGPAWGRTKTRRTLRRSKNMAHDTRNLRCGCLCSPRPVGSSSHFARSTASVLPPRLTVGSTTVDVGSTMSKKHVRRPMPLPRKPVIFGADRRGWFRAASSLSFTSLRLHSPTLAPMSDDDAGTGSIIDVRERAGGSAGAPGAPGRRRSLLLVRCAALLMYP